MTTPDEAVVQAVNHYLMGTHLGYEDCSSIAAEIVGVVRTAVAQVQVSHPDLPAPTKGERAIAGFGCPKCGVKAGEKCRKRYTADWDPKPRYYDTYRPHNERLARLDRMDLANEAKAQGITQRELQQLRAGTHHSQRALAAEKAALYEFKLRELEALRDWLQEYGDIFEVKKRRTSKTP